MKKRYFLLALSTLVMVSNVPYLFQAWRSSRLDSWDWSFYLLAVPALVWAWEKVEKWDFRALIVALPALAAVGLKNIHQINALSVAGGIVFIWSMSYLIGGWKFAYSLLPGFVVFLLGTPSSSYRLAQLFTVSTAVALGIKFALAGGCFIHIFINKRFALQVKAGTVLFIMSLLCSALLFCHARELNFSGRGFVPEFAAQAGVFYGRNIEPDQNTKRFFATSSVRQYRYIGNDGEISVLAVKCGKNIHEIHPASHCLRTSYWVVTSEKIVNLKPDFAVTEIEAHRGRQKMLIWVWYSCDDFSTPGFLGFRRRFRPDGNYHTFQISVPVYENVDSARTILKKFVAALSLEKCQ